MRFPSLFLVLATTAMLAAQQPTREQKVRDDKKKVEADGFWIYNDLAKGIAESKKSGKPILAIMRCIPCEECVKLDDDLVNKDKRVRPLLDKYVCVRIVSTNGLDLSLFQFDYDQSFAAFMLNSDGKIYGRFGTRSHRTQWSDDVSIEGLANALQGGLELHEQYPKNTEALAHKKGPAPEFATPELFPTLKAKYTSKLNYEGNVVQSCIHCHQIGDAQKNLYRLRKEAIPDKVLFPYPHPKAIGLILDPKERATVLAVEKGSPAEAAGFQKGDAIQKLDNQPLLSIADVQWVLHHTPSDGATLKADVKRGESVIPITLKLDKGWRDRDDLSWRSSTWGLRRMALGGMVLEPLTVDERTKAGIPEREMVVRVKRVGQYGPHATAKNAGFREGDVIVTFDGRTDLFRETDVMSHAVRSRKAGEAVEVVVLRDGKKTTLKLPMQE